MYDEVDFLGRVRKGSNKCKEDDDNYFLDSPLAPEILAVKLPKRFKMPKMDSYNGTTNPRHHLNRFLDIMFARTTLDALYCKMFPSTITGVAMRWYVSLKPSNIHNFSQLKKMFIIRFLMLLPPEKTCADLLYLTRGFDETLREYMIRFYSVADKVNNLNVEVALSAMMNNCCECHGLFHSLYLDLPTTVSGVRDRTMKYVLMDEKLESAYASLLGRQSNTSRKDEAYDASFRQRSNKRPRDESRQLPLARMSNSEELSYWDLLHLTRWRDETLREYVHWFQEVAWQIKNLDMETAISTMAFNCQYEMLSETLLLDPPTTLSELMLKVCKYVQLQEAWESLNASSK